MDNRNDMLELLKLYDAEWKFRQENLWKKKVQFFIIIFFTSTLPVSIKIFDDSEKILIPDNLSILFPIVGIFLTIFFLWFCLAEAYRLKATDSRKNLIISKLFSPEYEKNGLTPFFRHNKDVLPIFEWPMAVWVPIFLSVIELFISIFMLLFLTHKI